MRAPVVLEEDLRKAVAAGWSPTQAAKHLGVYVGTVYSAMKRYGIDLRRERDRTGQSADHRRMVEAADDTRTLCFSASPAAIARALEALGKPMTGAKP